jgi:uncharacterized membrane protein YoaK (UPF0700 family)
LSALKKKSQAKITAFSPVSLSLVTLFLAAEVAVAVATLLDFEGGEYNNNLFLFVGAIQTKSIQKQPGNNQQGSYRATKKVGWDCT